jgi:8-oxo-dGTP diphosphatase
VLVPCVGGILTDGAGRLLVIRRGHPPAAGRWSLPGGRVEAGEAEPAALAREMREETGALVAVGRLAGVVERDGPAGVRYRIADYHCRLLGGRLAAGDDAAELRWVTPEELRGLPLTDGLAEALTDWRVLPGDPGR